MKRSLLMFSAIVSFVVPAAAPLVAVAQERPAVREGRGEGPRRERSEVRPPQRQERPQRAERRAQTPQAERPSESQMRERFARRQGAQREAGSEQRSQRPAFPQDRRNQQHNEARQEQRPQIRPDNRQQRPGRPDNREGNERRWESDRRPDSRRDGRPEFRRDERRPDARRDERRSDGRWQSDNRRPDARRERDRSRYRDFQRNWNRDQWRRDWDRRHRSDWWRNDTRFRNWNGARVGFYFAPGYGYYSVPRSYWNRRWNVGQFLPDVFWRYQVNDYRTYGLGYPPEGTRWVYVDNSIYLIDEYDGYIVEVIRDAWRW